MLLPISEKKSKIRWFTANLKNKLFDKTYFLAYFWLDQAKVKALSDITTLVQSSTGYYKVLKISLRK